MDALVGEHWDINSFDNHPVFGKIFLNDKKYYSQSGWTCVWYNHHYHMFYIQSVHRYQTIWDVGNSCGYSNENMCFLGSMGFISFCNSNEDIGMQMAHYGGLTDHKIRFDTVNNWFVVNNFRNV